MVAFLIINGIAIASGVIYIVWKIKSIREEIQHLELEERAENFKKENSFFNK